MGEYIYKLNNIDIILYKIEDSKLEPVKCFEDREDLLIYLEKQGYSKLYIIQEE